MFIGGPKPKRTSKASDTSRWQSDPTSMPANLTIPNDEPTVREVFDQHWREIRTRQSRRNKLQDWYNFRLESDVFRQHLDRILADQSTVFRLNMSFGFVLRNT